MQEKIEKESEDINKKALEAYMQELEKRGKAYIEELEKERKFLRLAVVALIIGGAFLNTYDPIWHIKFWLELFVNSVMVVLLALIVYLVGAWFYSIFLGIKWIWKKKIKKVD
jgi:cation transport ATPase